MRVDLQGGSVEFKARESVLSKIEASLQPGFEPVQPKYAATVMLVRDSAPFQTEHRIESDHFPPDFPTGQELEVFMLRRVKTMEFVPDAVVFPGGRVDDRDSNPNLPWCGPAPAEWAELMGCTEDVARRVVVAAAREVFEECGVLLGRPRRAFGGTGLKRPFLAGRSHRSGKPRDCLCRHAHPAWIGFAHRLAGPYFKLLYA